MEESAKNKVVYAKCPEQTNILIRTVCLPDFYLGEAEATNEPANAFVEDRDYIVATCDIPYCAGPCCFLAHKDNVFSLPL